MNLSIPCVLMRAGTSRGPFFLSEWLPSEEQSRNRVLVSAIGSSDQSQINGLGGGTSLTSKVAIVSPSTRSDCDVDYLFAQVGVGNASVDTRPNCGNMLAGVAPFAIEQGLVTPSSDETAVRVHNVNTGARIDVTVRTPEGRVRYDGDVRIDGVAEPGAPIYMSFLDAWGAITGKLFPTGERSNVVDGVPVTCIDAAMPLVVIPAAALGLTGRESAEALDADTDLLQRIERIRRQAGALMGLGDVSASVVPKPVLVSPGDDPNSLHSRYFTPHRCHTAHAVTGAIGVATAYVLPGTVASAGPRGMGRHAIRVCHPSGAIQIAIDLAGADEGLRVERASVVRTARKILEGRLEIPAHVLNP
jgi:2-methylaconitate cis-trans-isomerase PrpF